MKYNNKPVYFNKLAQNVLDATTDFVQSNKYIVVEPGLTSFTPDEVISHHDLINFLTDNSLDEISILPLAENV
tara:strand:- start:1449 stop:1667 length:219 start_codon:yes stop_codon:yes gene_type:complete